MIDPHHMIDPPPNVNKELRDTSSVLSEFWHDWGERRPDSSGDSMAYEYAIRRWLASALTSIVRRPDPDIFYIELMVLRETTED